MTRLLSLVLAAALATAVFAVPAVAAESGPHAAPTARVVQDVAAPADTSACILAIVEDRTACTLTVAAIDGRCPGELVPLIEAAGYRLYGSDAFLKACADGGPSRPPLPD